MINNSFSQQQQRASCQLDLLQQEINTKRDLLEVNRIKGRIFVKLLPAIVTINTNATYSYLIDNNNKINQNADDEENEQLHPQSPRASKTGGHYEVIMVETPTSTGAEPPSIDGSIADDYQLFHLQLDEEEVFHVSAQTMEVTLLVVAHHHNDINTYRSEDRVSTSEATVVTAAKLRPEWLTDDDDGDNGQRHERPDSHHGLRSVGTGITAATDIRDLISFVGRLELNIDYVTHQRVYIQLMKLQRLPAFPGGSGSDSSGSVGSDSTCYVRLQYCYENLTTSIRSMLIEKNEIQEKLNSNHQIAVDIPDDHSPNVADDDQSNGIINPINTGFRKLYAKQIMINMILFSLNQSTNVAIFGVTTAIGIYAWGKAS